MCLSVFGHQRTHCAPFDSDDFCALQNWYIYIERSEQKKKNEKYERMNLYKFLYRPQRVSCAQKYCSHSWNRENMQARRQEVNEWESIGQRGKFSNTSLIRPTTEPPFIYRYTPTIGSECIAYFSLAQNRCNIGGYNIFHRVYSTLHRVQCALVNICRLCFFLCVEMCCCCFCWNIHHDVVSYSLYTLSPVYMLFDFPNALLCVVVCCMFFSYYCSAIFSLS